MSVQKAPRSTDDYIAQVDLFTTGDGPGTEIVAEGDYRARFLLARKGTPIPHKLAKRLGIDEDFKLQPVQLVDPNAKKASITKQAELREKIAAMLAELEGLKTVSPEEISNRATRPEQPAAKR